VAEHEIEALATFADRLIVLDNGRITEQGNTREILTKVKKLKEIGIDPPSVTELCDLLSNELLIHEERFPITLDEATVLFSQALGGNRK
jgi:energy-coupling factor transport system ATP-binding protein